MRIRLDPALLEVSRVFSSFKERAHLVLESLQALIHKIQALSDLCTEILLRTLRVASQYPVRKASRRESRSRAREPRGTPDVVRQTVRIALDSAHVEGASFTSGASLYTLSHASSHTALRTFLRSSAPDSSAHSSLLRPTGGLYDQASCTQCGTRRNPAQRHLSASCSAKYLRHVLQSEVQSAATRVHLLKCRER
jgi:hypothetical protein